MHSKTILNSARTLLAEVGDGFTMEQLETHTGISRATLYRRLGTKEALLKRLAEERGEVFTSHDPRLIILQAVRTVLSRNGFAAATMEQFATEAGVSVATVYRHFGDKESLLHAFAEEMTPRRFVRAIALQPSADMEQDLTQIFTILIATFNQRQDLFRLIFMGGEAEQHYLGQLRQRSGSPYDDLCHYFQTCLDLGYLQSASPASELALALIGMVTGFSLIGPLHFQLANPEPTDIAPRLAHLFLNSQQPQSL